MYRSIQQAAIIPLGVSARLKYWRGSGVIQSGTKNANIRMTLAGKIAADERILYMPKAGEILYRWQT
jgi:hypothetical protein